MSESADFLSGSENRPVPPDCGEWESRLFHSDELYRSGIKILEELRGDIEAGNYAILLGDDASGRIPTRLLGEVVKEVYKQHGFPQPKMRFVAGTGASGQRYPEKEDALAKYSKQLRKELPEDLGKYKVLVISDIISTGNSLTPLTQALRREGIPFDVVALAGPDDIQSRILEERWGTRIVQGVGASNLYSRPTISGVEKRPNELHARPFRGSKDEVGLSRADAKVVAQKLLDQFSGPQGSSEIH